MLFDLNLKGHITKKKKGWLYPSIYIKFKFKKKKNFKHTISILFYFILFYFILFLMLIFILFYFISILFYFIFFNVSIDFILFYFSLKEHLYHKSFIDITIYFTFSKSFYVLFNYLIRMKRIPQIYY